MIWARAILLNRISQALFESSRKKLDHEKKATKKRVFTCITMDSTSSSKQRRKRTPPQFAYHHLQVVVE